MPETNSIDKLIDHVNRDYTAEEQHQIVQKLVEKYPLSPDLWHEMFHRIDENQDGTITPEEFRHYFTPENVAAMYKSLQNTDMPPVVPAPSSRELRQLMFATGVPFVGFGFLDNVIMLTSGELIDASIGSTFHLSTLAAAALGNTVSDVAGIGMSSLVSRAATNIGIKVPHLSRAQRRLPITHTCTMAGSVIGIAVGCILGMFPLFFTKATPTNEPTKVE